MTLEQIGIIKNEAGKLVTRWYPLSLNQSSAEVELCYPGLPEDNNWIKGEIVDEHTYPSGWVGARVYVHPLGWTIKKQVGSGYISGLAHEVS